MAAESDKLFEITRTSEELSKLASNLLDLEEQLPCNRNQVIRPGSQLSEKLHFHDKNGNVVSAYPVIVDFRRLLQLHNTNPYHNNDVISGISNDNLLHAVVGLYDIALSEMTLDVLYATVCEKWARTIVLVQDMKDAVKDAEFRKKEKKEQMNGKSESDDESNKLDEKLNVDIGDDKYEEEEGSPSKFEGVFSDVEDDEEDDDEEEEDESDEEDFSVGIHSFIKSAVTRRKQRNVKETSLDEHDIGVESRIIGCLTFEKKYVRHKERVVHLTIVTVRPRYRKYGIGKYLLSQVIDSSVSGQYEAIVVHADNGAVEFFQKFGFSDDVVLNSRWSELAEQFTNCTLMCYLPGFTGHTVLSAINLPGLEVYEMDQELKKWKDKTLESYQAQITCVMRMKQEIFNLQKKVKCQDNMIKMLAVENEKVKQEKIILEKELMIQKLNTRTNMPGGEEELSTSELITRLQEEVNKLECSDIRLQIGSRIEEYKDLDVFPMSPLRKHQEPYDHMMDAALFYDISQQFKEAMHADPCIKIQYEVTSVHKATLSNEVKDRYKTATLALHDSNMVTQLYYCGGLENPQRLNQIMQTGFTEQDFSHGEFGRGLYFSKYPSRAAQFSAFSILVLVEVGLGSVETVTKPDRARTKPSSDADSIITPGRLYKLEDETHESMFNQEYVIFNTKQILPLCLINYVTADHGS
ncbi:hypothetical protein LOTGIDRAFT_233022 [Lottia gigantea]|uniref:glucosamine-phosphate N-acetyltransferase n=1 Tax=Lottia gigantea TaxID=225164 RepID=V4AGM8_LOTGI|nr:hypothetical protein LOTGIDRAFT_233022 [Lottia gigantea]ESO92571.1 hypothetical protein LOTGIDRAFT_233022 [Lottia gigantea]